MDLPENLRYTREHEWVRLVDGEAAVGITDFAQDALGDVVFVELPTVGGAVAANGVCSEIESTKSVSEIYSPIEGVVVAVNEALAETPELINRDPYGEGWIMRLRPARPADIEGLLDAASYRELVEGE